eukprot:5282060-Prymnesium_polylepis.1
MQAKTGGKATVCPPRPPDPRPPPVASCNAQKYATMTYVSCEICETELLETCAPRRASDVGVAADVLTGRSALEARLRSIRTAPAPRPAPGWPRCRCAMTPHIVP